MSSPCGSPNTDPTKRWTRAPKDFLLPPFVLELRHQGTELSHNQDFRPEGQVLLCLCRSRPQPRPVPSAPTGSYRGSGSSICSTKHPEPFVSTLVESVLFSTGVSSGGWSPLSSLWKFPCGVTVGQGMAPAGLVNTFAPVPPLSLPLQGEACLRCFPYGKGFEPEMMGEHVPSSQTTRRTTRIARHLLAKTLNIPPPPACLESEFGAHCHANSYPEQKQSGAERVMCVSRDLSPGPLPGKVNRVNTQCNIRMMQHRFVCLKPI